MKAKAKRFVLCLAMIISASVPIGASAAVRDTRNLWVGTRNGQRLEYRQLNRVVWREYSNGIPLPHQFSEYRRTPQYVWLHDFQRNCSIVLYTGFSSTNWKNQGWQRWVSGNWSQPRVIIPRLVLLTTRTEASSHQVQVFGSNGPVRLQRGRWTTIPIQLTPRGTIYWQSGNEPVEEVGNGAAGRLPQTARVVKVLHSANSRTITFCFYAY